MDYYLDAAATTPVDIPVLTSMFPYFRLRFHNPSASYTPAYEVSKDIEAVRASIADFMHCRPSEVYFTSGASESNAWAMQGWLRKHPDGRIITTNIEHKSIMSMVDDPFFKPYFDVIPVNEDGYVVLEEIYDAMDRAYASGIRPRDILVAIQYANNEIGTRQDILFLAEAVKAEGSYFFTDATQAFAEGGDYLFSANVDMMSMSGHKIGAPKGIGLLFMRDYIDLPPLIYGTQNSGKRGGTENVPYIIALGRAFEVLKNNPDRWKIVEARDCLCEELKKITPIKINGGADCLCNNLNITFLDEDINGQNLVNILSAMGVYISVGSACSAHSDEPSYVLKAIGLTDEEIYRTVRITLPYDFKEESIPDVVEQFEKAIDLIKESKK